MPALPSLGLNRFGSVRTARPTSTVVPTTTATLKTPYWAGTEASDDSQVAQPPTRHIIQRKPVGVSAEANTIPPPSQSIPRKPVPSSPEPALAYTPVQGDPYRADSVHQWAPGNLSSLVQGEFQQQEIPLSPGSIFANGRPQRATTTKSKTTRVLSRGFGSICKVAGKAKDAAAAVAVSDEPKISTPVAGSFHRSERNGSVIMNTPLHLVGIEVAQADQPRYGKPDYLLNGAARIPDHQAEALAQFTGEPVRMQSPPEPVAPAAPSASKLKQPVSRKVVNDADRETAFGDIIAAAQDSSWVAEPEAQAPDQALNMNKGKGRATGIRAPSSMPPSLRPTPSAGNPFTVRSQQMANIDKTLPPSPAPGSLRRQTPAYDPTYASQANVNRLSTSSLSEALEAEGARRASYVPEIKCSDCGKMIDVCQVSDHRCGQRAAQAVDYESRVTGPSRADKYETNYGPEQLTPASALDRDCTNAFSDLPWRDSCLDEPPVIVDTFVRQGHTSWELYSGVGSAVQSLKGHISGGTEAIRRNNTEDAMNGWNVNTNGMS
jgi:hypothetical protein